MNIQEKINVLTFKRKTIQGRQEVAHHRRCRREWQCRELSSTNTD